MWHNTRSMWRWFLFGLACLWGGLPVIDAQEKKPAQKLEARLVVKNDTYELDLAKQTDPKLDIVLRLHNPTAKDIRIVIEPGDEFPPLGMSLELKGPGATSASSRPSPQKFFEGGYAITIPAGKTVERGIAMTWGGKRQRHGVSWTKPGDYTLSVRCVGDGKEFAGFLTEPVKLKVIQKKADKT